ncbi:hypothetical protein P7C71_g1324, partial [Lecanoromycetidae sp. Uapishka_2]
MNGAGMRRQPSYSSDYDSRYSSGLGIQPSSKTLLDGYNGSLETTNEERAHQSEYGNANENRMRSSELLDPNDPVSMHLLMETAMGDSQRYEVLSFEEADELKKELVVLSTRIDATKRKLAIENKLRDAATSLNRLYTPNSRESITDAAGKPAAKRHRRSTMRRNSGSDLLNKTDDELAASTKKCEDLAQELWKLEKRYQDVQRQILEHTAGVLQMTHKGFLEKDMPPQNGSSTNGYVDGISDLHILGAGHDFDEKSFYKTLDNLLDKSDSRANGQVAAAFEQQTQSILETERKIWDLNKRLRDSIAQVSAGRQMAPAPPSPDSSDQQEPQAALQGQIEYLERGIDTLQRSQAESLQGYKQSAYTAEERLEDLNTQLRGIIVRSSQDPNPQYPLPPDVSGKSPEEQIAFLEGGLDVLEQSVQRIKDEGQSSSSRSLVHEEKAGQYENILLDLWQKMVADEETTERFSLASFSTKFHSLHARNAGLQEQKDILNRQIEQQREINSKSDSEKDARLTEVSIELDHIRKDLEATSKESITEKNALKAQLTASNDAKDQLLAELKEKHNAISTLETQLHTTQDEQQHQVADMHSLEGRIQEKSAEADKARTQMQDYEGEMVRLQTELTVARAELDGAYGTRAQRAAEVASHPALLQEISDLKSRNQVLEASASGSAELKDRVQTLQKELSETIGEYEIMTKSSIEYEKEREHLENTIDSLRDRCEGLESQLTDEKVHALGVKSPGRPGSRESQGASSTSTSVLKNEFKKLMRETRQENMRALRFEQNERRKLEAQVRTLTKDQTPGKSSLSQSMTPH